MAKKIITLGMVACSLPFYVGATNTIKPIQRLPSNQGFTGLTFTPNAQSLEYGDFSFTYAQGLPWKNGIQELDSLKFSFGLLEGLEAHGRIVTDDYNSNCFITGCGGIRDLSMSLKYQLPNWWNVDNFNLAVGVQDLGGASNHFNTHYVVADYTTDFAPLRFSAGYGMSDIDLGVMDGPFGGVEYQPFSFMQITGEYDSVEFNSSLKVFTPEDTLPYDITASLSYQLYSGHDTDEQNMWNAALSVPLISDYTRARDYSHSNLTLTELVAQEQRRAESASLAALVNELRREGFVNIQLGTANNMVVIALENRRYNHNQIDGVGVAMGIISSNLSPALAGELGLETDRFELVMLANQKPVVSVRSSAACYQGFVSGNSECDAIDFNTRNLAEKLELDEWKTERVNSGVLDSQLVLSPMVRHGVATEYGVYDYSFAMSSNLYTYLWSGAALDVRHILPLAESDDFEPGGVYAERAYENEIDRAMLHQFFRLPYVDIANQVSVGLVKSDYAGIRSESAWFSPSGAHALGLEMSYFELVNKEDNVIYNVTDRQTFLTSYTFTKPEWDWQFKALAGEFWRGDVGAKLTTSHWFEDIEVSATYQISEFSNTDQEQFAIVSVKLPLTPWRDMSPGLIQLRGNEAYDFNVSTRVGDDFNHLGSGQGDELVMDNSMLRRYFNRGRYGSDYFEVNKIRMRNAYWRYLESQL